MLLARKAVTTSSAADSGTSSIPRCRGQRRAVSTTSAQRVAGSAIGLGKAIGYHALERDGQALAQRREGLLVGEGCMPRLLNPGVATRATAHGQERIALGCHGRSKSSLRSGPVELGELLAHDYHPRGRSRIAGVDAKERRQRLELLGGAAVLDRPADVNA